MIVTLAGHVDHGKTSLVRALTGVDTDRLAEEKRRGLTIDLGFAYLETDAGTIGFVDVPGHHKFIHNMVAGVASRQFALLVIAADDGPMPQSREHLQILQLLGLEHGVIALSKTDRVAEDRIDAAADEIRSLTANTFLSDARIIPTSAVNGDGIDSLREALVAALAGRRSERSDGAFRLAVDRAFSVTGAGVVVTGTVHSGSVSVDDTLHLFPDGRQVRVRGLRAQDQTVTTAGVGDRCAVNLGAVDVDQVRRGHWLSGHPDDGTREVLVDLEVLDDFPRQVRHWLPVHVYQASAHTTGHIALLEDARLAPGSRRAVELVTAEPLLARRGDRLIIRDQGLDRTLGGGTVLASRTAAGRRRSVRRLQRLEAEQADTADEAFARHLALGEVDLQAFQENWSLDADAVRELVGASGCIEVAGFALTADAWQQHLDGTSRHIAELHRADASLQGVKQSDLVDVVPGHLLEAVLSALVSSGELSLRTGRYLPARHQVELSASEQMLLDRVTKHLDQPQPPSLGDLAKLLRISIAELGKGLVPLVAKKRVVKVSDSRYYLPDHVARLASLAEELGASAPFTVRQYRDASGIGRNVAIEVLEFFDARGFTRRNGDTRRIAGGRERLGL